MNCAARRKKIIYILGTPLANTHVSYDREIGRVTTGIDAFASNILTGHGKCGVDRTVESPEDLRKFIASLSELAKVWENDLSGEEGQRVHQSDENSSKKSLDSP